MINLNFKKKKYASWLLATLRISHVARFWLMTCKQVHSLFSLFIHSIFANSLIHSYLSVTPKSTVTARLQSVVDRRGKAKNCMFPAEVKQDTTLPSRLSQCKCPFCSHLVLCFSQFSRFDCLIRPLSTVPHAVSGP